MGEEKLAHQLSGSSMSPPLMPPPGGVLRTMMLMCSWSNLIQTKLDGKKNDDKTAAKP
jgi:hypothetical protein